MTDLGDILVYLSLGLIILWTVRLARSKGRNPFLWGGMALLLMLIPSWSNLLGMAPMVALLFMRSPQTTKQETVPETITCPKCHAYHALGHTFCVNCGWELARPFSEPPRQAAEPVAVTQAEREQGEPQAHPEPAPEQPSRPVAPQSHAPVYEPPSEIVTSESFEIAAGSEEREPEQQAEPASESEPEEQPQPQPPVVRYPITPTGFTDRGLALMAENKFQEAVDQFAKALALNPEFLPALEHRAEAYDRLGVAAKAEDDRNRLRALQSESSDKR